MLLLSLCNYNGSTAFTCCMMLLYERFVKKKLFGLSLGVYYVIHNRLFVRHPNTSQNYPNELLLTVVLLCLCS